jgi:flavin-dependent dehydrogenase
MWHVNRRSFDKALLIQAAASGTEVLDRTSRLIASFEKEPCGWTVRFLCSEVQRTLSTTYLIDATGRSSLVGRRLGSKRALHDQLAAVWCIREYKGEILPLLVEAVPQGWWYSLAFPENMLLVALVTDPAAVNVSAVMRPRIWDLALQQAPYTKRRLGGDENRLTVTSVESARLNRMSGEGWIAIGDAAMSYDPLSSYGLGSAVEQAMEAAELLCSQNIEAELTKFEVKRSETYKEYQQQRNAFYESVLRFAESEFWRRRV